MLETQESVVDAQAAGETAPLRALVGAANARPKTSRDLTPFLTAPERVLFLDIETTGLSRYYDKLTLVGFEIDGVYDVVLAGESPERLHDALASASSIVTFNGSTFDLPFLEVAFPDIRWPQHHVDLRYACRRLGLTGGQKRIEGEIGVDCREGLTDIDGAFAVVLWHRYLRGDVGALRQLIDYNRADVRAMTHILDHVIANHAEPDLVARMRPATTFARQMDMRLGFGLPDADLPNPPVRARRAMTFQSLFAETPAAVATVVGLDLTGSAKRPSGFAVTRGDYAETMLLSSDDEILESVFAADPDLVSIDSPLCLPVGRTCETDDDPMRNIAGIMRVSERILKRRGINVYPCLLPSMQRLTARGIRLAAAIRARGIPTIECYPGAAQDIMGIPRKGAGLEWLRLGLEEFGVQGAYVKEGASHDELDAITCSLVGSFHLAGQTEAIGGVGEEPMMVPDLHAKRAVVVGISGSIAAGKTTASKHLQQHGFGYTRISMVIDETLRELNLAPTRKHHQEVGMRLHEEKGQSWLCRRAIELLPEGTTDFVIDGLRWTDDVRYFRERFGGRFLHIHITAPEVERRKRYNDAVKGVPFDIAVAHPVEQGIAAAGDLADVTLANDGALASFLARVEELARSWNDAD
nr:ribonuclease H-like domain-containing protein [Sphingomonas naasensis]